MLTKYLYNKKDDWKNIVDYMKRIQNIYIRHGKRQAYD